MLSPNTPLGTMVMCIDTRGCFSTCRCGGNHQLGPLVESRIYVLHSFEKQHNWIGALAGYAVLVSDVGDSKPIRDGGYAPDRFRVLEPVRQQISVPQREPVRVRELELA